MPQGNSIAESTSRKQGLLKDQVRLVKRKDNARYEIVQIKDTLSFEKGFFVVIRACQMLAQKNDGIILVGLAGPSGAGKTAFSEKILNFMPSVALISMDNYNDATRVIDGNFDDPRLTDYDTLLKNIHDLKEGKTIEVPIYDFKSSFRTGYRDGNYTRILSCSDSTVEGAHTIGMARCTNYRARIYGDYQRTATMSSITDSYLKTLKSTCPAAGGGDNNESAMDYISPNLFDNSYYHLLLRGEVLLASDQELYSSMLGVQTSKLVQKYAENQLAIFEQFSESMVKLGNITNPETYVDDGEVRKNCRFVNT